MSDKRAINSAPLSLPFCSIVRKEEEEEEDHQTHVLHPHPQVSDVPSVPLPERRVGAGRAEGARRALEQGEQARAGGAGLVGCLRPLDVAVLRGFEVVGWLREYEASGGGQEGGGENWGERTRERKTSKKKRKKKKTNSQSQQPFALSLPLSIFVPEPHFERVITVVLLELGLEEPVIFSVLRERERGRKREFVREIRQFFFLQLPFFSSHCLFHTPASPLRDACFAHGA